jgi:hydrogenase large subunit
LNKIELIEKIEGEAKLHFSFDKNKKIDFVDIEFLSARNIEQILEGKPAFDALVINPRVCGICGHAHLITTVKALEDCYDELTITKKAEILREITLNFELIANHFKWFYLTIMPLFGYKQYLLKATKPAQIISKAIAILAGQYPHNSYAIVGGITGEPTHLDMVKVTNCIEQTLDYFGTNILALNISQSANYNDVETLLSTNGDLPTLLKKIKKNNLQNIAKSFDRFIVFGNNSFFKSGKSIHTRVNENLNIDNLKIFKNQNSLAKNVQYRDKYYEVGPLSRAMLNKVPLIKDSHRKYGDSIFSRLIARIYEIPQLLEHNKMLIKQLTM